MAASPATPAGLEAFLGPTAASLVNLDTLIPANPPTTSRNPFLSGLSAPSPTNPFHCDQPRLTLNQLRPCSTSPLPPPAHTSSSSSSSPVHYRRLLPRPSWKFACIILAPPPSHPSPAISGSALQPAPAAVAPLFCPHAAAAAAAAQQPPPSQPSPPPPPPPAAAASASAYSQPVPDAAEPPSPPSSEARQTPGTVGPASGIGIEIGIGTRVWILSLNWDKSLDLNQGSGLESRP
ncbi:hypothetical protein AALO_G00095270 [Alosa alosa]|uniref:Uncharacterized protein n=1 Tax=Alosa alosa TaxID=278164 RepID=A0AAV6GSL1_9TELE|nr:hypothetical protein AALO_G00095270 [Alosa alosa]